jgi:AcrR family transcriptional regulator
MGQTRKPELDNRILNAAKKLFIQNGFQPTSLRDISKQAKVTLSNLYNYYPDKNSLFTAVLKAELSDLERLCEFGRNHAPTVSPFGSLSQQQDYFHLAYQYINKHRKELHLLFNQAAGSSLEKYPDYLIEQYQRNWNLYFKKLHKQFPSRKFKKPSVHFLKSIANLYLYMVRLVISEHYSQKKAAALYTELATFIWHGGMGILSNHE